MLRSLVLHLTAIRPSLQAAQIGPDDSLVADLGLDSLDLMTLSQLVEEQLGEIDLLPWLARATEPGGDTVGGLAAFLSAATSPPARLAGDDPAARDRASEAAA